MCQVCGKTCWDSYSKRSERILSNCVKNGHVIRKDRTYVIVNILRCDYRRIHVLFKSVFWSKNRKFKIEPSRQWGMVIFKIIKVRQIKRIHYFVNRTKYYCSNCTTEFIDSPSSENFFTLNINTISLTKLLGKCSDSIS